MFLSFLFFFRYCNVITVVVSILRQLSHWFTCTILIDFTRTRYVRVSNTFENMIMMLTTVMQTKSAGLKIKYSYGKKWEYEFQYAYLWQYARKSETYKCKVTLSFLLLWLHSPHGIGWEREQFSDFTEQNPITLLFLRLYCVWFGSVRWTSEVNLNDSIRFNLKLCALQKKKNMCSI